MDRDLDALIAAPAVSRQRLGRALGVSVAVMTAASLAIQTLPDEGRRAGHDAVIDRGVPWLLDEVAAASGTALGACNTLHRESLAPQDDYESFINGCAEAVDRVLGRHVPLLPEN